MNQTAKTLTIEMHRLLSTAAAWIMDADALIISAGAGMGVDSGLPDFRGNSGFWRAYPALGRAKIDFYSIASPDAFQSDPLLAWGFYGHRLALYRETAPHPGFGLLKSWGEAMKHGYQVFTSNVDGQFQKAGFSAERIFECHGSIHYLQCLKPCSDAIWSADTFVPQIDEAACRLENTLPRCPLCTATARPNILMFGDWGWIDLLSAQQYARQRAWLAAIERPVVIELGAGSAVPTVRHFSERIAGEFHGRLIRINPTEPQVPANRGLGLPLGALEALNALDGEMNRDSEVI